MRPEVLHNVPLSRRSTIGLGGTALAQVLLRAEEELHAVGEILAELGGRPFVLGAGSNILFDDGELGIVLLTPQFAGTPEMIGQDETHAVVRVGAGVKLQRLLNWLASEGLAGLEGLRGIPGSVGGAVAMNAGSWGASFCERLEAISLWIPEQGTVRLERGQWEHGYRHFLPEGGPELFIVTHAELRMDRGESKSIRSAMSDFFKRKKNVQPVSSATAGCVFKNPDGDSAGRLLDEVGFRGIGLGGMAFSEKHANFLVNLGGGRLSEALELIRLGKQAVKQRFDHELQLEVKVVA
ncbi:MAG: UDP-N-acetylmuramate dehydrogenase [Desulfovibrio sp.]|uniref:UDP-N-acetylmuramate dehydrogenase n=1 Tax=Desulfovibrio sp. 7SRBS1 TaxID=3378064 RepID=UPI003B400C71